MGELFFLFVGGMILVGLLALIVAPFVLLHRVNRLEKSTRDLQRRLDDLEAKPRQPITGQPFATPAPAPPPPPPVPAVSVIAEKMVAARAQAPVSSSIPPTKSEREREPAPTAPPPTVALPRLPKPFESAPINWEQFMGVKLFAWAGGFVLFLALIFFLRYAFEHRLISPPMQVAGEYALAFGLLVGGLWLRDKNYAVLSQTLCATGVVALYAVTFAARTYYQLFGVPVTFGAMSVVTLVAFLLAVRREAIVVAVLGLVGGYLTPLLVWTGQDNPVGLFGYAAVLDVGLLAMATRKRWWFLVPMAVAGTVLLQVHWTATSFGPAKFPVAMTVLLGFEALFVAGCIVYHRWQENSRAVAMAAAAMGFVVLAFGFVFLGSKELCVAPWRLMTMMLLADAGLLALAWTRPTMTTAHVLAGGTMFAWLAAWTGGYLVEPLLRGVLTVYLLFALMHGVGPVLLNRWRGSRLATGWSQAFPLLTLLLVLWPVGRLMGSTQAVWGFVLVVDLVVIGLAVVTRSKWAVLAGLTLSLLAMAVWIGSMPVDAFRLTELLVVIGGFAVLFFVAGAGLARWMGHRADSESSGNNASVQVPVAAAVMPFVLLAMVVIRLDLVNPSPVFGLAMGLVAMMLIVARWARLDALSLVALGSSLVLQLVWHDRTFQPDHAAVPLAWAVAFYLVLTVFPFLFQRPMQDRVAACAAAALAGPLYFLLIHNQVKEAYPNPYMGLLPAIMAVPALLALGHLAYRLPRELPTRTSLLAWFGGSTLFFVTMIFPVQWSREWLTIGWALEGAALLWLRHRVPHRGLLLVGTTLLAVAFVRLALNPAVLDYHPRTGTPIWNWYLYAYGLVTVALMAGGKLAVTNGKDNGERSVPVILYTMGTVLAFLLVNIEIADFYAVGSTLTFEFHGNFGRDMTYSIAWALFALVMLLVGVWRRLKPVRVATMMLIGVTLAKLFLHDLASLAQLYRIGAFVGVALVLLAASFLYQRFFAAAASQSTDRG